MASAAAARALTEPEILELPTPHGPARVHVHRNRATSRGALVLGHGAGGGVGAPDLAVTTRVALEEGLAVVLVEQPYRVAGRRSPPAAKQLDAAWLAVIEGLRHSHIKNLGLIAAGRSSGARVACRTARKTDAIAVLCLAFPLHPPARKTPAPSRLPELEQVEVPVLVVQGERDPFGMPPEAPGRTVAHVPGDHSLRKDSAAVADAIHGWLAEITR